MKNNLVIFILIFSPITYADCSINAGSTANSTNGSTCNALSDNYSTATINGTNGSLNFKAQGTTQITDTSNRNTTHTLNILGNNNTVNATNLLITTGTGNNDRAILLTGANNTLNVTEKLSLVHNASRGSAIENAAGNFVEIGEKDSSNYQEIVLDITTKDADALRNYANFIVYGGFVAQRFGRQSPPN